MKFHTGQIVRVDDQHLGEVRASYLGPKDIEFYDVKIGNSSVRLNANRLAYLRKPKLDLI